MYLNHTSTCWWGNKREIDCPAAGQRDIKSLNIQERKKEKKKAVLFWTKNNNLCSREACRNFGWGQEVDYDFIIYLFILENFFPLGPLASFSIFILSAFQLTKKVHWLLGIFSKTSDVVDSRILSFPVFFSWASSIRTGWASMIDSRPNGPRLRLCHLQVGDEIVDEHCKALNLLV